MEAKRYHPLIILLKLGKMLKNMAFPAFFLFVIKINSNSPFIIYGRYAFLLILLVTTVYIIFEWFTKTYQLDHHSFTINKGIITKSQQTVPFTKIQNVSRHTSLFHKLFQLTSICFETSMTGEDATIVFDVLTKEEADRIEKQVANPSREKREGSVNHLETMRNKNVEPQPIAEASQAEIIPGANPKEENGDFTKKNSAKRTVHFRPTKQELMKASFTSLSFLVLIPLLMTLYDKIEDIFHVEKEAKDMLSSLLDSWWVAASVGVILLLASVAFGIARTFLKYGNYEISSDNERIYIKKGMVDETAFSILKERVQAIEITQSPLKRILGLAEVKLTSAGNIIENDDSQDINSLYPFLPVKSAYQMISELLPSYQVTEDMEPLPGKSWAVRLLRPSWLWMIVTVVLYFLNPSYLGNGRAWWIISTVLLVLVLGLRALDTLNTRFVMNERFIQIKKGKLTTTLFVSKRDKIIEVEVSRGPIQTLFGLASIGTVNRGKPVHYAGIDDIPQEIASQFYSWYIDRRNEIEIG